MECFSVLNSTKSIAGRSVLCGLAGGFELRRDTIERFGPIL